MKTLALFLLLALAGWGCAKKSIVPDGSLADDKLIMKALPSVAAKAHALGAPQSYSFQAVVAELPSQKPGARAWKEIWRISGSGNTVDVEISFQERGSEPTAWTVGEAKVAGDVPLASKGVQLPKSSKPADWPELHVYGVMGKGASGAVQLNDALVKVGETRNGVRVAEIAPNGVWVEFQGERRLLAVEPGGPPKPPADAKSKKSADAKKKSK